MIPNHLSTTELDSLFTELQDERQCKRGVDGFERPLYVSPMKWAEVRSVVAELIARRKRDKGA